jgi:putative ABC transport system permease protein
MYFVDSTFLQLFDFPLLKGNRQTALQGPNSVVLTESGAEKLFGKTDPIGKTVMHYGDDTLQFVVTGVLKNVQANSQFQFEGLFSFNTIYKPEWMNGWGGNWLDTYFELEPGANPAALEKKFPAYLKKYLARNDNWKMYELFLLPLKSIHAGASDIGLDYINYQKFDNKYTRLFFVIALIVLLIACINFVNLSTAKSLERAKEVGIRKSIGAYRWQLSLQFISESIVLSLIASILAIALVKLFLPSVNRLSDRVLVFPLFGGGWSLLLVLGGSVIVGILSGLYPAAYLSSFKAAKVLKGSVQSGRNKGQVRNILVVGQFSSAIFLMIATIFAVRQLNFMRQQDPGYSRDQVVNIPLDGITYRKYDLLKQELSGSALVSGVTASRDLLGSHLDQTGVQFRGQTGPMRQLSSTFLVVDHDYLTLYQIPLVMGNNFSADPEANGKEYIVNEALAKELLKEDQKAPLSSLIGAHFGFDSLGKIVGIAKDFNFNSLHYKIETLFLINEKQRGLNNISVKINGSEMKAALSFIGSVWKKNFPDHPFEYQFLDEHFAELYSTDNQVSKIVEILAGLAIFISCLGLFGLASYSAEKRTKEIGIRKVLGASVRNIVGMLSRDFLRYVFIAALIAWPLAWWSVTSWLQDYAYRIPVSWWVFLLAGLGAVVIALATISFQAIRAAVANPVSSLRSE